MLPGTSYTHTQISGDTGSPLYRVCLSSPFSPPTVSPVSNGSACPCPRLYLERGRRPTFQPRSISSSLPAAGAAWPRHRSYVYFFCLCRLCAPESSLGRTRDMHFLPLYFFLAPPFPFSPCHTVWGCCAGVTGVCYRIWVGLLSGYISYVYIACIMHVSCMYLDVSRSRYIKIHQDTFVSVTLAIIGNVSYLGI